MKQNYLKLGQQVYIMRGNYQVYGHIIEIDRWWYTIKFKDNTRGIYTASDINPPVIYEDNPSDALDDLDGGCFDDTHPGG